MLSYLTLSDSDTRIHNSTHKHFLMRVAVIQGSPILFNKKATIQKVVEYIHTASEQSADLILFPEAFIPAYPRGLSFGAPVGIRFDWGKELWNRYWKHSVDILDGDLAPIQAAAQKAETFVALGVVERTISNGSLYCSLIFIDSKGKILGVHRKLKPTAAERIIWAEGDGSTLKTYLTPWGKIGGLICWENYMPLARTALYHQGIQIYLAPTADDRETWITTMQHIALEGRCFVLGCNQFVTKDMYPTDLPGREELDDWPETMSRGGSVIVNPLGKIIEGPCWDKEDILIQDLSMDDLIKARMDFDVAGHYHRPDVFNFSWTKS